MKPLSVRLQELAAEQSWHAREGNNVPNGPFVHAVRRREQQEAATLYEAARLAYEKEHRS